MFSCPLMENLSCYRTGTSTGSTGTSFLQLIPIIVALQ